MTDCLCAKCHRPAEPRRIGASQTVRWGHVEVRRGGDRHPVKPPRLTESELRLLWTESEKREAFGR